MGTTIGFIIGLAVYFVPAIVAFARGHKSKIGVTLFNLFLGWTLLGWVFALIWSFGGRSPKKEQEADAAAEASGVIAATGAGGRMTFNGREVTITRKGVSAFLIHGTAGEKSIAISSINAVQLRGVGGGLRGYLQLTVTGGVEKRGGAFNAAKDENSVLFDKADQPAFERLAEAIKAAIHDVRRPTVVNAVSEADELAKLAELRDKGVLSDEEFAAKKAKILG